MADAPIGRIQRDQRGLLNWLGIVGETRRPSHIEDDIKGTVDMAPWLGSTLFQNRRLTGNVQAPGSGVNLSVPAGEAWYMIGGQFGVVTAGVGEIVACSFIISMPPDSVAIRIAGFEARTAVSAIAQLIQGVTFPQAFILLPGSSIQLFVDDSNLAVPRTGSIAAVCYPFAV